ncbi:MAG: M20/M25/M40 family metallo-hydrolase [Acidobacteriota bacterium]|nr:M20/M25/M40 family metallo-hydrolase [Acidobacteriota bacterium]
MPPLPRSATHLAVLLALAALSAPPSLSASDENLSQTIIDLQTAALADSTAIDLLRSLTADVGSRFAGTPGDIAAVTWAEQKMRQLGFTNVRTEPVTVPRWVRGEARGHIVGPHPLRMMLIALGGSVGTPDDGITAEVVAVDSLESLDALPGDALNGKIVFFNQRMERARDGSGYGRTVGIRTKGAAAAARKGAIATLIRSVGTGTHRFPHTGQMRYEEGTRRIPAAALAIPDADVLETRLAANQPVVFNLFLGSRYLDETESANVIGEIEGREETDEIVLLGAHLDSWDVGHGAIDDGAGCATVLAAGHLLGRLSQRPRRTIRVVLFANEEFGLSGAKAYADRHAETLDTHQLATESDFGAGRIWRFATRLDPLDLPQAERLAPLLAPLGIDWYENTGRGGADLRPLREAGVPVADLTPDGTYYFDYHHTEDDTFDKVAPDDLAQNVAAMVSLAYFAAEIPMSFRHLPPEETP